MGMIFEFNILPILRRCKNFTYLRNNMETSNDEVDEEYQRMIDEDNERVLEEEKKKEEEEAKFQEKQAENKIEEIFNDFKKIKEETMANNKINVIKINYSLQHFIEIYCSYMDIYKQCGSAFPLKFGEIVDSVTDSFYLSVTGRYKTAYSLMRKILELFAIADYIDETFPKLPLPENVDDWIYNSGDSPISKKDAIQRIDNSGKLYTLYRELCKFTHNDGTENYKLFLVPEYNKKGFDEYADKMIFLLEYFRDRLEKKIYIELKKSQIC